MTYPCPFCLTPADLATGCPGCGRGPDRDAAEVVRLDTEIPALTAGLKAAKEAVAGADAQLRDAWQRRDNAAARVRAAVAAAHFAPAVSGTEQQPAPLSSVPPVPVAMAPVLPPMAPRRSPEASTKLVQNVLFLLGGLLLGVAAIVFTAVAWTTFGVGGRAVLLAAFTAAALAVPPLALRRSLNATAETFAAVGLLLVLLDGYAAWYVDLFGIADVSGAGYAGAVFAVTAAIAVGYETVTGLTGPKFAALIAAQPVLPLLFVPAHPGTTGWPFIIATVALLNVLVVWAYRDRPGTVAVLIRVGGYLFGCLAAGVAGLYALVAIVVTDRLGEAAAGGAALVTVALVLVAAAVVARSTAVQAISGGLLVIAAGIAACRYVHLLGGSVLRDAVFHGSLARTLIALVAALLAAAVVGTAHLLPAGVRRGPWLGALVVLAVPTLVAAAAVLEAAFRTLGAARPVFDAGRDGAVDDFWTANLSGIDLQVPIVVLLLTAALTVLLPRRLRLDAALTGAALVALAAPAAMELTWWSAPILDLAVAAAALAVALREQAPAAVRRYKAVLPYPAFVAGALVADAVAVGYGLPVTAASTLAAVTLLGVGAAVAGWRNPARHLVGGAALAIGLLALPAAVGAAAVAVELSAEWSTRVALATVTLLTAVPWLLARRWAAYRAFAVTAVAAAGTTAPLWTLGNGDSTAIYAGVALVLVALVATTSETFRDLAWAVPVPALTLTVTAAGSVLTVLVAPYGWLSRVWTGRPGGAGWQRAGLDPAGFGRVEASAAVAVLLAAIAVAIVAQARAGRRVAAWYAIPVAASALPIALTAVGTPWPVVPALTLALGLAGALLLAFRVPPVRPAGLVVGVLSGPSAGAGLAALLPTQAMTLVGLGAVGVCATVAGAAGRGRPARLTGWLTAIAAAWAFAFTVGRVAALSLPATAFGVLAVAAVALALGAVLSRRRPLEGLVVQAAAHAAAGAALLLTIGFSRYAAVVCTLWGVAVGVRALLPGESADRRRALVVAAAVAELVGWWLLVTAERGSVLELYTLPAAAVALLAGWLARRSRPELRSWIAYGSALAAALLPTLASVLIGGEGQLLRRLLLGAGALAVVLLGAYTRLQAPVVVGGGVLIVVALHELVQVWELVPRWIPLAVGGLLLVALAMTLERRRRDLARVRAAVARLG